MITATDHLPTLRDSLQLTLESALTQALILDSVTPKREGHRHAPGMGDVLEGIKGALCVISTDEEYNRILAIEDAHL